MFARLLVSFLVLLLVSCKPEKPIEISMFHWKANYSPTPKETDFLKSNRISKLYVRYFDVTKVNGKLIPVSSLNHFNKDAQMEYVPCVYITQQSLKGIKDVDLKQLAKNVAEKITELNSKNGVKPRSVLIDCDWTPSTQQPFFDLLLLLKEHLQTSLMSTIRLHQLKNFEQTGVPPVTSGMFMMYNMGELNDVKEINSILNLEAAQKYKRSFTEYPLKLNIALPIFSWLVLFRDAHALEIISEFDSSVLQNSTLFSNPKEGNYILQRDTFLFGKLRYKYDQFRYEESKNDAILEMVGQWANAIETGGLEIALYDLRPKNINDRNELVQGLENLLN